MYSQPGSRRLIGAYWLCPTSSSIRHTMLRPRRFSLTREYLSCSAPQGIGSNSLLIAYWLSSATSSPFSSVWMNVVRKTSAKNISIRAEWLRQSGRAPSEPSERPRWQITPRPASIPRVALHIAHRSPFRRFFSLCRSRILNKHSGVVANCDHTSEWVHWVHAWIGIAMQRVTLRKSVLAFLLY